MKGYTFTVKIRVQADDEDHAIEQSLDMLMDGQYNYDIEEDA